MIQELNFNCPCCNESIFIKLQDNKIILIQHNSLEVSEQELSETLNKLNIEFG